MDFHGILKNTDNLKPDRRAIGVVETFLHNQTGYHQFAFR